MRGGVVWRSPHAGWGSVALAADVSANTPHFMVVGCTRWKAGRQAGRQKFPPRYLLSPHVSLIASICGNDDFLEVSVSRCRCSRTRQRESLLWGGADYSGFHGDSWRMRNVCLAPVYATNHVWSWEHLLAVLVAPQERERTSRSGIYAHEYLRKCRSQFCLELLQTLDTRSLLLRSAPPLTASQYKLSLPPGGGRGWGYALRSFIAQKFLYSGSARLVDYTGGSQTCVRSPGAHHKTLRASADTCIVRRSAAGTRSAAPSCLTLTRCAGRELDLATEIAGFAICGMSQRRPWAVTSIVAAMKGAELGRGFLPCDTGCQSSAAFDTALSIIGGGVGMWLSPAIVAATPSALLGCAHRPLLLVRATCYPASAHTTHCLGSGHHLLYDVNRQRITLSDTGQLTCSLCSTWNPVTNHSSCGGFGPARSGQRPHTPPTAWGPTTTCCMTSTVRGSLSPTPDSLRAHCALPGIRSQTTPVAGGLGPLAQANVLTHRPLLGVRPPPVDHSLLHRTAYVLTVLYLESGHKPLQLRGVWARSLRPTSSHTAHCLGSDHHLLYDVNRQRITLSDTGQLTCSLCFTWNPVTNHSSCGGFGPARSGQRPRTPPTAWGPDTTCCMTSTVRGSLYPTPDSLRAHCALPGIRPQITPVAGGLGPLAQANVRAHRPLFGSGHHLLYDVNRQRITLSDTGQLTCSLCSTGNPATNHSSWGGLGPLAQANVRAHRPLLGVRPPPVDHSLRHRTAYVLTVLYRESGHKSLQLRGVWARSLRPMSAHTAHCLGSGHHLLYDINRQRITLSYTGQLTCSLCSTGNPATNHSSCGGFGPARSGQCPRTPPTAWGPATTCCMTSTVRGSLSPTPDSLRAHCALPGIRPQITPVAGGLGPLAQANVRHTPPTAWGPATTCCMTSTVRGSLSPTPDSLRAHRALPGIRPQTTPVEGGLGPLAQAHFIIRAHCTGTTSHRARCSMPVSITTVVIVVVFVMSAAHQSKPFNTAVVEYARMNGVTSSRGGEHDGEGECRGMSSGARLPSLQQPLRPETHSSASVKHSLPILCYNMLATAFAARLSDMQILNDRYNTDADFFGILKSCRVPLLELTFPSHQPIMISITIVCKYLKSFAVEEGATETFYFQCKSLPILHSSDCARQQLSIGTNITYECLYLQYRALNVAPGRIVFSFGHYNSFDSATQNPHRLSSYPKPHEVLNSEGLSAPAVIQEIHMFEENNFISIVYNVVDKDSNIIYETYNKEGVIILMCVSPVCHAHHVSVLAIHDSGNTMYLHIICIRNLSWLVGSQLIKRTNKKCVISKLRRSLQVTLIFASNRSLFAVLYPLRMVITWNFKITTNNRNWVSSPIANWKHV
ncbi:hypothetical protein PR048_020986 [Dryococelus australis]|uniref:Uncharacterized protein n=1 Tax=Dryococelus australis TaxID=614101 RepID=A0ABQ9GWY8_9NEOP|nr:hypothetical protein PR048_020986 [Dryococelus australis]